MTMAIFKTDASTLPNVIAHAKHALYRVPNRLIQGDRVLIAQTLQSLQRGKKQIRFVMSYVRSYRDTRGESDQIWGRHWPFIIEGTDLRELTRPFNIAAMQITSRNYGQGGPVVYVDPVDEKAIESEGYL